jgi:putative membrane protein
MIATRGGSVLGMLRWQQSSVLLFTSAATLVVAARELLGWEWLELPTVPVAIVGGALGIFVSFRTNAAYARWWEGRQLWGRLINTSRTLASQVLGYMESDAGKPSAVQRAIVERHLLYVHVLRCVLREQDPWKDEDVKRFSTEAHRLSLAKETSPTHALAHQQHVDVAAEAKAGRLSEIRLDAIDRTLAGIVDVQGGCERIKKTPMPPGYGYFAQQLIRAFGVLFPMAIAEDLVWAAIPISVLVSVAFLIISEVGRVLEDPFTLFWNGLPLYAMSRTIENNLRQRLGDADILPMMTPDANGILM